VGLTLAPYTPGTCCLCGAAQNLTGEHKIKASAIRSEFGTGDTLAIRRFGETADRLRYAQSPKSKAFHFEARLCHACNSERTQGTDLEFDRFHAAAKSLLGEGRDPREVFLDSRYAQGSEPYLKVFRYFAKLLCCHTADVGAPRRIHVANFALGSASANCVWLSIDEDWTYRQAASELGPFQYAAHGGLVVYGDKETGNANAFHSSLTIGAVRYVFFSRLNWLERLELKFGYPEFYQWCRANVAAAKDAPLSDEERLALGL
jgi:hypothetical protein